MTTGGLSLPIIGLEGETRKMKMRCHQFLEIADAYLGSDLSVETNHAVNSHLACCAECCGELAIQHELREKLQDALVNSPENLLRPEFVISLRAKLRNYALKNPDLNVTVYDSRDSPATLRRTVPVALAACLIVVAGIGTVLFRASNTPQTSQRDAVSMSPNTSITKDLPNLIKTSLAKSAVGDHIDCAIRFRLSEKPVDLDEAGRKYDPSYINLSTALLAGNLPDGLDFVAAHSCVFETRRFAHLVFRYQGRRVSLLITDNDEARTTSVSLPHTVDQDAVIECSQYYGYRVSCLRCQRHAIFVVSDLSEVENLTLARALVPPLALAKT